MTQLTLNAVQNRFYPEIKEAKGKAMYYREFHADALDTPKAKEIFAQEKRMLDLEQGIMTKEQITECIKRCEALVDYFKRNTNYDHFEDVMSTQKVEEEYAIVVAELKEML